MNLGHVIRTAPAMALIVSSILLNVALVARVARQQEVIKSLKPQPILKVGEGIGEITGTSLDGEAVRISSPAEQGVLLYVYSASCGWCERNGNNMRAIVLAAREKGLRVYALALVSRGAREFLEKHGVEAEIVIPSAESRERYSFGGTPQTLIIGADGKLIKNWPGALVQKTASDAEAYFSLKLPGLIPQATAQ